MDTIEKILPYKGKIEIGVKMVENFLFGILASQKDGILLFLLFLECS